MTIDRNQILAENPIDQVIFSYGIELKGTKKEELTALCPFHVEHTPSFTVNPIKGVFYCFGCGASGSVIDFVSKKENMTVGQAMEKLSKAVKTKPEAIAGHSSKTSNMKILNQYEYKDEKGELLYKVIRYEPKTFRQARKVDGKIVWNLEGVRRVLYRLPEIMQAGQVIITEGEKDVETLVKLNFQATCNSGGAGNWLDGYAECLRGKDVVICGDNDEPGRKHVHKVIDSLTGKVKSIKVIKVPDGFKDVSDWSGRAEIADELNRMIGQANNVQGADIPIYSMGELREKYRDFVKTIETNTLSFDWLPSLKKHVRGLVPGELLAILADTGVGKTAIVQNIAFHAAPMKVLLFELELADHLIFERFTQIQYRVEGYTVENAYRHDIKMNDDNDTKMNHIFTCPMSRQTPESIEKFIVQSELKIGRKPQVVIIDYVGLVSGEGKSRYEKLSQVAEEIKRIAKATGTIIIIASQIHRKEDSDGEIYLHDAKDSGSIENSAGLVLGAWKETQEKMILKILKNTKGSSGWKIPCNFNGKTLTITEMKEDKLAPYIP